MQSKNVWFWTSLVVQGPGICLPGIRRVQFLVWEDSTLMQGTQPVRHNY